MVFISTERGGSFKNFSTIKKGSLSEFKQNLLNYASFLAFKRRFLNGPLFFVILKLKIWWIFFCEYW